jgi:SAM-dependent methyltransferase
MKDEAPVVDVGADGAWVGWCCSHCAAPLAVHGHGLFCASEGRWFATLGGVHRLLPEDRRRELQPILELQQRARREAGWKAEPGLPEVPPGHPHAAVWRRRARALRAGLALVADRLGRARWSVLEVGGGCGWAAAPLLAAGHRVAAVDVNVDPEDGLGAVERVTGGAVIPLAEAEMEALPVEPRRFDLVVAPGSLHQGARLSRALVEIRRVTRRGGVLLVLDSPVFRRREDGEAGVARAMREEERRYGVVVPRESRPGYLVLDELQPLFTRAGWTAELHDWPDRLREMAGDAWAVARGGRRGPRFPVMVARRDG